MKRGHTLITLILFITFYGCERPKTLSEPHKNEEKSHPQKMEMELDKMEVSSVDLYHHDPRPTLGETRKPTLWLHAQRFTLVDEDTWDVEVVQAVVYDVKTGTERMKLYADRGYFDKEKGASLLGNVRAEIDEVKFRTESIEWMNPTATEPARIWTKGRVELEGENLFLKAGSLMIYPESKEFELQEVIGQIPLTLEGTL